MATLASALLLTAVTMAQADQMSDVLKLPPQKHQVHLFEVISDASVEDLKAALGNFTIEGSYKVVGESRFFFEVISNDTAALHVLTFPSGSDVMQHPVQYLPEYVKMFEVEKALEEDEKWPDTVLFFIDKEIRLPVTMCSEEFAMVLKEKYHYYTQSAEFLRKIKAMSVLTSYPPRVFFFTYIEENAVQNILKTFVGEFGQFGTSFVQSKRIVKI